MLSLEGLVLPPSFNSFALFHLGICWTVCEWDSACPQAFCRLAQLTHLEVHVNLWPITPTSVLACILGFHNGGTPSLRMMQPSWCSIWAKIAPNMASINLVLLLLHWCSCTSVKSICSLCIVGRSCSSCHVEVDSGYHGFVSQVKVLLFLLVEPVWFSLFPVQCMHVMDVCMIYAMCLYRMCNACHLSYLCMYEWDVLPCRCICHAGCQSYLQMYEWMPTWCKKNMLCQMFAFLMFDARCLHLYALKPL